MRVDIQKIIDAIEIATDFTTNYYDAQSGEVVCVFDSMSNEDHQELCDEIENNPDRFYRLPSQYDIHEYSIMEDFIDSLDDSAIRNKLYRAIQGKGAFRRFKDEICYLGIREKWFAFQHDAYVKITKEWCKDNQLEYLV